MDIVYFIYGLSFFVLGVLVLFVRPKESDLFFANKIWLLGMFAILHAIVEWTVLYQHLYPSSKEFLSSVELLFLLFSYLSLFEFSRFILRKSFEDPHSKLHFIHNLYAAQVIYIVSISTLLLLILIHPGYKETIVAIRYTYGFWGSLFLGIGLYYYGDSLKETQHITRLKYYFKIAGVSFMCYSFFAGLVVPYVPYFPGFFLNEQWFQDTFHVPVQLFRALCALAIAISSIKALEIFRHELIEKLNESFVQIKEFNSNASHQLKTPLSSMKVQVDVMLQKDRKLTEYKSVLSSVSDEISSLQKMLTNLLMLTRMGDDAIKESFNDVEIDTVLLEVIGEYMMVADQKKITLEIKTLDHLVIAGNETLISIFITNLIDNAIKYTPKGKKITIGLYGSRLSISDEGIGIDKDKLPFIFNKFFQVNSVQKKDLGGYGLGLAMVKKIVDLHKGSVYVQSKINEGTTFLVKFGS